MNQLQPTIEQYQRARDIVNEIYTMAIPRKESGEKITQLIIKADERDEISENYRQQSEWCERLVKERDSNKAMWKGQINRTKLVEAERDSYKEKADAFDKLLEASINLSEYVTASELVDCMERHFVPLLSAINAARKEQT